VSSLRLQRRETADVHTPSQATKCVLYSRFVGGHGMEYLGFTVLRKFAHGDAIVAS